LTAPYQSPIIQLKGVVGMAIHLAAIYHEAKSKYAYAYDKETVHIRIRTEKNDVEKIRLIYGDPFNWGPKKDKAHEQEWKRESSEQLELQKEYTTNLYDYWFVAIKPKYRRAKYVFILEKDDEQYLYGSRTIEDIKQAPEKAYDLFNYFNFPFINPIDVYTTPEWASNTIWYQIFPERFHNGNKENDPENVLPWNSIEKVSNHMFFGGDLEGVIQKLDYIKDLGVNGIYFTPIFQSPSSHKYDTTDYFAIDPQFGDLETMKRLVEEAHKRGIKVMLDAVFNHCGWYHPFFQDVLKNGEASAYKDYFHIKKFPVFEGDPRQFRFDDGENILNYDSFAFTPFMPKWNTENEEVKTYLLKVATYWIEECDIDAWRLDVSNEVDHAFWRDFRKACDAVKKDFFIVGENWDDSNPWLQADQMHSVMNYEYLFSNWNYFGNGSFKASDFMNGINKLLTLYPKHVAKTLFNLLDSHDTKRILTTCENNKQKVQLAFLFLLSFSGTPSIYYGSEISLAGEHDPDNRRCMVWEEEKQDLDMFQYLKRLIELRKQYASFKAVDLTWLDSSDETNHLVYKKQSENETTYFIINNQNQELNLSIDELNGRVVTELYQNTKLTIQDAITIEPYGFRIIQL
jgi:cyclomaltodextrinase / maltogenic alpha-amylase / neopullulanase